MESLEFDHAVIHIDEVGRTDLCFRTERSLDETVARLQSRGVAVEAGPIRRFGSRGWGTSVYCRDPSGNGVELIAYDQQS